MIIEITASLLILMSYSVFNINWKHLKLMSLVRLISWNCNCRVDISLGSHPPPVTPSLCVWLNLNSPLAANLMSKIVI